MADSDRLLVDYLDALDLDRLADRVIEATAAEPTVAELVKVILDAGTALLVLDEAAAEDGDAVRAAAEAATEDARQALRAIIRMSALNTLASVIEGATEVLDLEALLDPPAAT